MINTGVKANCKKCGRAEPADRLVLDPVYQMFVCQDCVSERKKKELGKIRQEEKQVKQKEDFRNKPAGWDAEDEYLSKAYQNKQAKPSVSFERIDSDTVKCKCPKCHYKFIFHIAKRYPGTCPFCGVSTAAFRF